MFVEITQMASWGSKVSTNKIF